MEMYTEKQQKMISKFLAEQLKTLKEEKRVGRYYFSHEDDALQEKLETVIIGMAEVVWD